MRQDGSLYNEEFLRQGSPANATFAETFPRWAAAADLAIAASGVELAVGLPLQPGDIVANITFLTGGTAADTPTAGYVVLRDTTGAKLVQSADFGSTARAANTPFTIPLASAYTVQAGGLYIVGISFTATAVPTLRGASLGNAIVAGNLGLGAEVLSQTHGAAVGATAPATIATPTNHASLPLLIAT